MNAQQRVGAAADLAPGKVLGAGTGRMVRGPQGILAKVPGLDFGYLLARGQS
jgi:hypothetical protein